MFCGNSFIIENMEEKLVISAIEPQKRKKDRYNIYAHGEYIASLGAQTLVSFGIGTGGAIDEETLNRAVLQDNAQYAFDMAASLLAHKMRTRSELSHRLAERGICDDAISAALDKLETYGYINDAAYAKEYVQSAVSSGRLGRRAVQYRLGKLGLPREITEEAMALYTEDDEKEAAQKQLNLLLSRHSGEDKKRKAFDALARRGFDFDIINSLLAEYDR